MVGLKKQDISPKRTYRKVVSSNTSRSEALAACFRLLMKWIFVAEPLFLFEKDIRKIWMILAVKKNKRLGLQSSKTSFECIEFWEKNLL